MGILNWFAAKAMGVPTVGQDCHDRVVGFLARHGIEDAQFKYLQGETSFTNPHFSHRVYYGNGARRTGGVSFVLHVNEDIPRPDGAVIQGIFIQSVPRLYDEWLKLPAYVSGSLYNFILNEVGGSLEPLKDD